jgi:uncharacterized protein YndB with AHSA1/START domain
MSKRRTEHTTFSIERVYDFAPSLVFSAWASAEAKSHWFSGTPDKWTLIERKLEFRVGGREILKGAWQGGPGSTFAGYYYDIVPDERIVYSYDMYQDETQISVSLATVEFCAKAKGTALTFTEQAVFLDDFNDAGGRKHGTGLLLDQLGIALSKR